MDPTFPIPPSPASKPPAYNHPSSSTANIAISILSSIGTYLALIFSGCGEPISILCAVLMGLTVYWLNSPDELVPSGDQSRKISQEGFSQYDTKELPTNQYPSNEDNSSSPSPAIIVAAGVGGAILGSMATARHSSSSNNDTSMRLSTVAPSPAGRTVARAPSVGRTGNPVRPTPKRGGPPLKRGGSSPKRGGPPSKRGGSSPKRGGLGRFNG